MQYLFNDSAMKQRQYINQRETGGASSEGMMKLSVLLLLALSAPSSASPLNIENNEEQRNVSFMYSDADEITANRSMLTDQPLLILNKLRQKRQLQASSIMPSDVSSNLEWVTWNDSLPNNSVSIYNGYVDRVDFVCKYECQAGFYTPSMGPCCNYPLNKAYCGSPFEILVNKDNFEILKWKDDSYGAVPQNSVRTCPGEDIYVGKDKYGLGKVVTEDKAFYLPWKGSQYWYHSYQVLTVSENIISEKIYDVKYDTAEYKIFHYPPEIIQKTVINNYECRPVVKTDSLSKTYEVSHMWDINFSVTAGVKITFTASIPFIAQGGIAFSTKISFQYSKGKSVVEAITDTVSVEITAPSNQSCTVNMVQYKYNVDIPFTALVSRTYGNGVVHTTSITGTYNSVQIGEVRAVADRCEPLENSKLCT